VLARSAVLASVLENQVDRPVRLDQGRTIGLALAAAIGGARGLGEMPGLEILAGRSRGGRIRHLLGQHLGLKGKAGRAPIEPGDPLGRFGLVWIGEAGRRHELEVGRAQRGSASMLCLGPARSPALTGMVIEPRDDRAAPIRLVGKLEWIDRAGAGLARGRARFGAGRAGPGEAIGWQVDDWRDHWSQAF
jgi:hypothetical protein